MTLVKKQNYPKTIGRAVNVTDPTQAGSNNNVELNTALSNIYSQAGGLTEAEKSWLDSQVAGQLQTEANNKYSVATNIVSGSTSYWADEKDTADMKATVKVTVKFDGTAVDIATGDIPSGWTKVAGATGEYTKEISTSVSAPSVAFVYKIPSGTYQGVTVTKYSTAKSISIGYPAWYGFYGSNDSSNANNAVAVLASSRRTSGLSQTADIANPLTTSGYLWIITKGSATAKQVGADILQSAVDITSLTVGSRSFTGYKAYISKGSASASGTFSSVELSISL